MVLERFGVRQCGLIAEELQLPGDGTPPRVCSRNSRRNNRERTRTGRKNPGRQAIQRSPSGEMPPPGTMMWTCGWWVSAEPQVCSTAVNADPRAEMLRVGRDGDERLGRSLEQSVVDDGLVLVGDVADRGRQGEDHVVVGHGQQLGLPVGQPLLGGNGLALRAMPIAAGVVGDAHMRAILAALDMAAESRGAAALDGRHDLQLREAHPSGVGSAPGRAVAAEDIRHLDRRS